MTEIRQFTIDASGNKCWGIAITPNTPGLHDCIVFLPGDGEKGDGTKVTVDKLYANGSPLAQARDGKLPGYIIIGLQGVNGQGLQPEQLGYALKHDILPGYRTGYLMVTGLSLGAQCALELAGNPLYGELPTFCFAMSSPTIRNEVVNWGQMEALVFMIHGKLDNKGLTDFNNSVRVDAAINAGRPGYSNLLLADGYGHDSSLWSKYYTPGTAITIGVKTFKDVYDLFNYISTNQDYLFPAGTGSTAQTNTTTMANAVLKLVSVTGKTASFDATGTTGYTSWNFQLNNPATGQYIKAGLMTGPTNGDGKPFILPQVTLLPDGNYIAELRVQPGNVVAIVPFSVGGAVVIPLPVPKTALGAIYNQKTGNAITVFDDDSTVITKGL